MTKKCKFKYAGAMALGMHDALVEITGIIAGLAFSIDGRRIIIMTGIIAAIAAALSMAAANYMAQRTERNPDAMTCAIYTGIIYITVSAALLFPFCIISNRIWAMIAMAAVAVMIIFAFNWWIGKINSRPWGRAFVEMLTVCAGVVVASLLIGQLAKHFLGVAI